MSEHKKSNGEEKTIVNMRTSSDDPPADNTFGELPTLTDTGRTLGRVDRYELLEKLGQGGFGAVYLALDTEANIQVALKALPVEISRDAEEMVAIRDNFSLVTRLSHPNIAVLKHLHKVDAVDERAQVALGVRKNDYLVVMEYATGATLFNWRRAAPDGKLPFFQTLEIARQIASALDYAHSQRVLHRDIKPKNIMIAFRDAGCGIQDTSKGNPVTRHSPLATHTTVKVLDFGLAAEIRSSMSRKSHDLKQSASGTPNYMAPEQWTGAAQNEATDQYALAVTVYELLSGAVPFKPAFDTGNFQIMRGTVCFEPAPKLEGLSRAQNVALQRALSKKPEERFPTCRDFVAALAKAKQKGDENRQKKGVMIATAGTVVAMVVVAGLFGISHSTEKSPATVPQQIRPSENRPLPKILGPEQSEDGKTEQPDGLSSGTSPGMPEPGPSTENINKDNGDGVAEQPRQLQKVPIPEQIPRLPEVLRDPPLEPEQPKNAVEQQEVADVSYPGYDFIAVSNKSPVELDWICRQSGGVEKSAHLGAGSLDAFNQQQQTAAKTGYPLEIKLRRSGIRMKLIPAGSFSLGEDEGSAGVNVELTSPFYCGVYEVSRKEWNAIMNQSADLQSVPIVNMAWTEINKFLDALCDAEGVPRRTYRLPTEAEWEYACRAGTEEPVYGLVVVPGDTNRVADTDCVAWFNGNSNRALHPVGLLKPNTYGLFDMLGNAGELCLDRISLLKSGVLVNPQGDLTGMRIVRGGSFMDTPEQCLATSRQLMQQDEQRENVGFRIVRSLLAGPGSIASNGYTVCASNRP